MSRRLHATLRQAWDAVLAWYAAIQERCPVAEYVVLAGLLLQDGGGR